MKVLQIVLIAIIIFVVGIGLGAYINDTTSIKTCPSIQGLWTSNSFDFQGQWVHVRVDNMKNISQALDNCEHEVAHEIFARTCETNITPCLEIMEK